MPNLGPTELLIILGIAVLIFGPSKLPELGSSIGRAIKGFKEGVKDAEKSAEASTDSTKTP